MHATAPVVATDHRSFLDDDKEVPLSVPPQKNHLLRFAVPPVSNSNSSSSRHSSRRCPPARRFRFIYLLLWLARIVLHSRCERISVDGCIGYSGGTCRGTGCAVPVSAAARARRLYRVGPCMAFQRSLTPVVAKSSKLLSFAGSVLSSSSPLGSSVGHCSSGARRWHLLFSGTRSRKKSSVSWQMAHNADSNDQGAGTAGTAPISTFPAATGEASASSLPLELESRPNGVDEYGKSSESADVENPTESSLPEPPPLPPLYRAEGLFGVIKPVNWTSSDVVSYLRGILERDARNRGAVIGSVGGGTKRKRNRGRSNKSSNAIRIGHGGTLDPLATGVLVIGVGRGTKQLQTYLSGSKRYRAGGELGYETTTLDLEGNVTRRESTDHITLEQLRSVLPEFRGRIHQVPPLFSALRKDGVKLYQKAREGATLDDVEIEAREVEIYRLDLLERAALNGSNNTDPESPPGGYAADLPKFDIDVECGGGTYIRSLIRDIGYRLGTVATTTYLERTQQGPFESRHCLPKDMWTADNIYAAIGKFNDEQQQKAQKHD